MSIVNISLLSNFEKRIIIRIISEISFNVRHLVVSLAVFQQPDERPEVLLLGRVSRLQAVRGRRGRLLLQLAYR